jgi:hypothetical protein
MRTPILAVDADARWNEVASIAAGDSYRLSDTQSDNVFVERICACLLEGMPGSDVRTCCVDSLTAIMAPLITQAILDNDAGRNRNRMAAFKDKALALRLLQDAINTWGTDVLYIYHLQAGRDADAKEQVTATVSRTELARLTRSINMQLRIVTNGQRAIHVDWARRGRSDITIVDDTGCWRGMPERIEEAVYGGLSLEQQAAIEAAMPTKFSGPEQAIAWGVDFGAFKVIQHSRNAYDKLKEDHKPASAQEMWDLWIADVTQRAATIKATAGRHSEPDSY